ncbi:Uncharacterised protein [uncultured Prevotella sp.]|nr:Uncharacterised protein [uncultured Prevotella sp.]
MFPDFPYNSYHRWNSVRRPIFTHKAATFRKP